MILQKMQSVDMWAPRGLTKGRLGQELRWGQRNVWKDCRFCCIALTCDVWGVVFRTYFVCVLDMAPRWGLHGRITHGEL